MNAELLARTTVHKGRIFQLEIDVVKLPTGHTVDMEVVRHPGSVVLLPIPEPGRLILIRQYRYTIDRWIWELPAGTLKPNEDPARAAARECEEEINLVPHSVTALGSFYPSPGFCDELMNFFRCEDLRPPASDSTVKKDDDEEIEPKVFTLAEARALIASGEIIDMKTLAGLSLLA
jgi:ADP-ribose pyrophosphatase